MGRKGGKSQKPLQSPRKACNSTAGGSNSKSGIHVRTGAGSVSDSANPFAVVALSTFELERQFDHSSSATVSSPPAKPIESEADHGPSIPKKLKRKLDDGKNASFNNDYEKQKKLKGANSKSSGKSGSSSYTDKGKGKAQSHSWNFNKDSTSNSPAKSLSLGSFKDKGKAKAQSHSWNFIKGANSKSPGKSGSNSKGKEKEKKRLNLTRCDL